MAPARRSSRSPRLAPSGALAIALTVTAAWPAEAHGLFGHVHVTGWAIENLPRGELRDFFDDPAVFRAALIGAAFPDTGYSPLGAKGSREYAEATHWEPFIEAFLERVRNRYGPSYEGEERLLVAFLLGVASHGLQDELFDSTFLHEVEQRDSGSQENADPGTDGFLAEEGHARLFPEHPGGYLPLTDLLALYAEQIPEAGITEQMIRDNVRTVLGLYVNEGLGLSVARGNGERYRPELPWTAAHYLDASVPGSLRAEITPTARHMQALWDRLHGRFQEGELLVHQWPEPPRRLREADHRSAASWVTLVFGMGLEEGSARGSVVDAAGVEHPTSLAYTRWGGTSRLLRFLPNQSYTPGGRYTVRLEPGARLVDGSTTTLRVERSFQVECDPADRSACPPVTPPPEPSITGRPPDPEPPTAAPAPRATGCGVGPTQRATWGSVGALVALALVCRGGGGAVRRSTTRTR